MVAVMNAVYVVAQAMELVWDVEDLLDGVVHSESLSVICVLLG
jgi:hypothetical protein